MNPIILIPARMASTRLPDKPMADIGGLPMIVHVWKRAMEANIGPVVVACDDVRIKAVIEQAGGQAVMTRADHPSGSDRIFEALQIIDKAGKYDVIVNVQGDVPTIEPATIRAVLNPLKDSTIDIATLAAEITHDEERNDPSVVKVVASCRLQVAGSEEKSLATYNTEHATALYFSRSAIPHGDGPLYHHIGIYAYLRTVLETFISLPPSPLEEREKLEQLRALEAGMRIGVAIVDAVPLGVDTKEHLEKARQILSRINTNF